MKKPTDGKDEDAVFKWVQNTPLKTIKKQRIKTLKSMRVNLIKEVRQVGRALQWVDTIITMKQDEQDGKNSMKHKLTQDEKKYIENRIESAALTLRRLPNDQRGGYNNTWPDMKYSSAEIEEMDKKRTYIRPNQQDVSEMEEVLFEWMKWLTKEERKLVWQRAERMPWKEICKGMGFSRTKVWGLYMKALKKIGAKL